MKTNIITKATSMFYKASFALKKHSPTIMVVGGCIGTVGAAVMAVKATPKALDILEQHKKDVETITTLSKDPAFVEQHNYTEQAYKNELTGIYGKTAIELAKTYAPAVVIGGLSIAAILTSNNIMKKRNIALASAYATIDKGFKQYRGRVIERFGEVVDRELKHGVVRKEVEVEEVNENGEVTKTTKTFNIAPDEPVSPYGMYFEEYVINEQGEKVKNHKWSPNNMYNIKFLKDTESYLNKMLPIKKRIFLNEAYQLLGRPKTKAGQMVGWFYDEECPTGDNFISFGLPADEELDDYIYNDDFAILLDFNVDGNIWESM